jgi:agmatinase
MDNEFFDLGPRQGRNVFVLPVPYEGTVSYGTGTRLGPCANALRVWTHPKISS